MPEEPFYESDNQELDPEARQPIEPGNVRTDSGANSDLFRDGVQPVPAENQPQQSESIKPNPANPKKVDSVQSGEKGTKAGEGKSPSWQDRLNNLVDRSRANSKPPKPGERFAEGRKDVATKNQLSGKDGSKKDLETTKKLGTAAAKGAAEGGVAGAALNAGKEAGKMALSKEGRQELARFAKSMAKRYFTGIQKDDLKKLWPIAAPIILVVGIVCMVIGMILFPPQMGYRPPDQYSAGNYLGKWCDEMSPSLPNGSSPSLKLPTPDGKGYFSTEDPVNLDPNTPARDSYGRSAFLQFWNLDGDDTHSGAHWEVTARTTSLVQQYNKLTSDDQKKQFLSDLQYYVTSRWPSQGKGYNWNGRFVNSKGDNNLPKLGDYFGKKIIAYNPKNGKAIVGIIEESGPAPWTGIGRNAPHAFWPDGTAYNPPAYSALGKGRTYGAARAIWGGIPDGLSSTTPPGKITSSDPSVGDSAIPEYLGLSGDDPVIFGFANNQSLRPGTAVKCTPPRTLASTELNTGATNNCLSQITPDYSRAQAAQTTITFDAWVADHNGQNKHASTKSVTVNGCASDSLKKAMEAVFNDPEHFALYNDSEGISGFNWRCRHKKGLPDTWCDGDIRGRSVHSWGLAVDINPDVNQQVGQNQPNPDAGKPMVIDPNGSLVRIMASYGWKWGGVWTGSSGRDYMHFSPINK